MFGSQGLAFDSWTPLLACALTVMWFLSGRLALRRQERSWRAIPLSLFGWVWVAFGIAFVGRFWVIAVDAVTYGDLSERLTSIPAAAVNEALILAALYWVGVAAAYRLTHAPRVNPLRSVDGIVGAGAGSVYDVLAVVSVVAMLIGLRQTGLPAAMLRPLGLIASLWGCAAAGAWAVSLGDSPSPGIFRIRRWIYLLPGVLAFVSEPYRERLLLILLIPIVAALFAGARVRLPALLGILLAFALSSTVFVATYRAVKWEGETLVEQSASLDPRLWASDPYSAPWSAVLRRFHSFDSLLFFTYLVPDMIPFEAERYPVLDFAIEAFVPRAIYPEKVDSQRAQIFAAVFWSYGYETASEANIAPSMPGDLYSAGGWHWVVIGALCWGLVLGLFDRGASQLSRGGRTVVICYLALLAAGGIERDFSRAMATIVQNGMVLVASSAVLKRVVGAEDTRSRITEDVGADVRRRAVP